MAALRPDLTIREYQEFIEKVYGDTNVRHFSRRDLLTNVQRFLMRGMKGIRKHEPKRIATSLVISTGWLLSLMNRLHIDMEDITMETVPVPLFILRGCPVFL